MTNLLHAAHYADRAVTENVTIVENMQLAKETFRVRVDCPELAGRVLPGQFIMMRFPDLEDPLLGRPLALYDTVLSRAGEAVGIDVVYLTVGKFTRLLAEAPVGQELQVWGPLGNGFQPRPVDHLIMVAGGIGQTPFVALAREYLGSRQFGDPPREVPPSSKVTLCYGARSADYLAGVEDFQRIGVDVRLSTDDGSRGHHGLVTELLEKVLAESDMPRRIVSCGPEPMLQAVAEIAGSADVPCQVSLETPMACGIGICFSCVAKVRDNAGGWDYKRTCVEGPVFDAQQIEW